MTNITAPTMSGKGEKEEKRMKKEEDKRKKERKKKEDRRKKGIIQHQHIPITAPTMLGMTRFPL